MPSLLYCEKRPSKLFLAMLSASMVGTMLGGSQVSAQVSTTYKEQQDKQGQLTQYGKPDVTGLWYHINQKQTQLANQELGRLKSAFPQWIVPSDIETALYQLKNPSKPSDVVTNQTVSNQKALNQAASNPGASKTPSKNKVAKDAPLQKFAQKTSAQRLLISVGEFAQLSTLADNLARYDYHMLLGWTALDKSLLSDAQYHFERAEALHETVVQKKGVVDGMRAIVNARIQIALGNSASNANIKDSITKDSITKASITRESAAQLKSMLLGANGQQVSETLLGEAWKHYDAERYHAAYDLFVLLDNHEGVWLSLRGQGENAKSGAYACEKANSQKFLTRCADFLASEQAEYYNNGQFQRSVDAGLALRDIRRLSPDEQALLGWSASKASISLTDENAQIARDAFSAALASQRTAGEASNIDIANALIGLESAEGRAALAEKYPSVAHILQQQDAASAWPRKQFILSYNLEDARAITSQTKDAHTVVAGLTTRSRSGDEGLGNFDVFTSYIGVGGMVDSWQWQVALDYQQLYSGKPASNSWFADGQASDDFAGIAGFEDKGLRAEVTYQQTAFNFYANLEYELFDQPVDAELTGQLSATWFLPEVTLATTLFHLPKTDSLLSQAGTFNSEQTERWGYVIADGISVLAAHSFKPKWAVAGTLTWASLSGDGVADNKYLSLRTDVNYNLAPQISTSLDYWRVGPFFSYLGYDENLSGFTYGHGGYFSPNYMLSIGGYSELLTMEAHRWQFKLSTSLGLSRLAEPSDPRFPLLTANDTSNSLSSLNLPYSRSTGLSGNMMFEGQYRISDKWIVAGYVGKAFAVEYQAFEAGIQIRWRPGKGEGVTSDELMRSSPRLSGFAL